MCMSVCVCVGLSVYICICVCVVVSKAPDLKKRLKDLLRQREDSASSLTVADAGSAGAAAVSLSSSHGKDTRHLTHGEFAMDIGLYHTHYQASDATCCCSPVQPQGHNAPLIRFLYFGAIYIVCLFISYAFHLIFFLHFSLLTSSLFLSSFENRDVLFPGRMS